MLNRQDKCGLVFAIIVALLAFAGVCAAINSAGEVMTSSDGTLP